VSGALLASDASIVPFLPAGVGRAPRVSGAVLASDASIVPFMPCGGPETDGLDKALRRWAGSSRATIS
jgi:hypothetical protein